MLQVAATRFENPFCSQYENITSFFSEILRNHSLLGVKSTAFGPLGFEIEFKFSFVHYGKG